MRQPRYSDIFAGHDEGAAMAEQAKVLWAEYKADLVDRGLWTNARGKTLDRLVRATVEYLTEYPAAVAEGSVRISDDGGQYVNMRWSMVQKLSDQISKLEKALTLTPESIGERKGADPGKGAPKTGADEFLNAH